MDGWGSAIGITAGTATGPGNFRRADHPIMVAAGDIILSCNGGPVAVAGHAILTLHWRTLVPRQTL